MFQITIRILFFIALTTFVSCTKSEDDLLRISNNNSTIPVTKSGTKRKYRILNNLNVRLESQGYGQYATHYGVTDVINEMRRQARALKADAIISANFRRSSFSVFSNSKPYIEGSAVAIKYIE